MHESDVDREDYSYSDVLYREVSSLKLFPFVVGYILSILYDRITTIIARLSENSWNNFWLIFSNGSRAYEMELTTLN